MRSVAIAVFLFTFIACKNQSSDTDIDTTITTSTMPMDSTVTDAVSSLGNYPMEAEPGIRTYDTIANAFKGHPKPEEVKQLMDTVLRQSNMEVSHDNVMRFANDLEEKRKTSKSAITEMNILKEMYQHGNSPDLAKRLDSAVIVLKKAR